MGERGFWFIEASGEEDDKRSKKTGSDYPSTEREARRGEDLPKAEKDAVRTGTKAFGT